MKGKAQICSKDIKKMKKNGLKLNKNKSEQRPRITRARPKRDACVTTWSKNFTNTTHSETYTSGGKIFAHNALKHVKEILYGGLQLVKVVPDSFKYQISVNFKITVGNAVPHSYDILPRYFRTF